jgi:hypothetical protein
VLSLLSRALASSGPLNSSLTEVQEILAEPAKTLAEFEEFDRKLEDAAYSQKVVWCFVLIFFPDSCLNLN